MSAVLRSSTCNWLRPNCGLGASPAANSAPGTVPGTAAENVACCSCCCPIMLPGAAAAAAAAAVGDAGGSGDDRALLGAQLTTPLVRAGCASCALVFNQQHEGPGECAHRPWALAPENTAAAHLGFCQQSAQHCSLDVASLEPREPPEASCAATASTPSPCMCRRHMDEERR